MGVCAESQAREQMAKEGRRSWKRRKQPSEQSSGSGPGVAREDQGPRGAEALPLGTGRQRPLGRGDPSTWRRRDKTQGLTTRWARVPATTAPLPPPLPPTPPPQCLQVRGLPVW